MPTIGSPSETTWIKDNAKRFAQQQGISEQEAEQRLAHQAQRQLQNGVEGEQDAQAMAFLGKAHGMLLADPNCPTCGLGYMFYATPEQKANPDMYASFLPEAAEFYQKNDLAIPTTQRIAAGAQRDDDTRDTARTLTKAVPVAAGAIALAGLSPTLLTWALGHPEEAAKIGLITAETAAAIQSGAITPSLVAEGVATKIVANEVKAATAAKGGTAVVNVERGALTEANFAQNKIRADRAFSADGQKIYSELAGTPIKTVDDLANALKNGWIKPSQLPVDYVDVNGTRLILNTRTSTALEQAGIPRSEWFGRNRTGLEAYPGKTYNDLAADQLKNNKLPPQGAKELK